MTPRALVKCDVVLAGKENAGDACSDIFGEMKEGEEAVKAVEEMQDGHPGVQDVVPAHRAPVVKSRPKRVIEEDGGELPRRPQRVIEDHDFLGMDDGELPHRPRPVGQTYRPQRVLEEHECFVTDDGELPHRPRSVGQTNHKRGKRESGERNTRQIHCMDGHERHQGNNTCVHPGRTSEEPP